MTGGNRAPKGAWIGCDEEGLLDSEWPQQDRFHGLPPGHSGDHLDQIPSQDVAAVRVREIGAGRQDQVGRATVVQYITPQRRSCDLRRVGTVAKTAGVAQELAQGEL